MDAIMVVVSIVLTTAWKSLKDPGLTRKRPRIEEKKEGSEPVKLYVYYNFKPILVLMRH